MEGRGAVGQAHDKEGNCFFLQVDRAFLGMGMWGERTFKFVLNMRAGVTAQGTGLSGNET